MKSFTDLLLDNGDIVRLEVPQKFDDEFAAAIENSMKRRDWFSTNQLDGCQATINGIYVERINMARVVAQL
jgi:hypothetical protein